MKKYKQFIAILLFVLLLFFSGCFFNNNKNEVYKDQFGYDRDVSKVSCDAFIFSTNYFMDNYGTYIGDKGDANLVSEKLLSASPSGDRNIIYFIFCGKAQNINLKISSVELIDDSSNLLLDKKAITFGSASVYNFSIDDKKSNVKVKLDKQKNIDEMISLTTDTDISFFALSLDFNNPYYQYFKIVFNVEAEGQTKQIVKQYGSNHNNLSIQKVTYDGNEVKDGDTLDIVLNQSKYLDLTFGIPRNYNYYFKVLVYIFKPNQIEANIDLANTADFEKLYNDDYQLISFNYSGSSGNDRKDFNIRLDIKEKVITESEIRIYFIPSFYDYSSFKFNLKDINDSTEIKNDEESIVYNNYSYYKVSNNNNITSVTIPGYIDNKPVIIAKDAFKDFKNLKSVIIEEGAFGISKGAFSGCSSLESITMPNSITMVEDDAFLGANDNIFYKDNNCYYLGNENNHYLVLVKNTNLNIEQFEINTNTSVIAGGAFENCNKLESIKTLFVKGIGNYAFKNCTSLKEFNGNDYLSFLGEGIFSGCISLDNLPISFIGFKNDSNNKFSIGYLFGSISYNNSYETIATCLINNETVSKTFYMPYNLTTVKIDNSIVPEYIFAGAKYVKNFELSNVIEIKTGAFMDCESMEKFSSTGYCTLHDSCFKNCKSLKEISTKGFIIKNETIFEGCQIEKANINSSSLKYIINPKLNYLCINYINISDIPLLLDTCPNLNYLELTDNDKKYTENSFEGMFIDHAIIHYNALQGLKNCVRELEILRYSSYNDIIYDYMFIKASKLEKLVLPAGITIKEAALYGCSSLKSLTIGFNSKVVSGLCYIFGKSSFTNSYQIQQHESNYIGSNVNYYCPIGLKEINYIGSYVSRFCFENMKLTNLSIPSDINVYLDDAKVDNLYFNGTFDEFVNKFSKCQNGNCYYLDDNGSTLYNGKTYESFNETLLKKQVVDNSLYYFENNKNIKNVIIPEGITKIYANAFKECTNLESIIIPNTVTTIGKDAFVNCVNLKSIIIPDSIEKIEKGLLNGCKSLESLSIPFIENYIGDIFGREFEGSKEFSYDDSQLHIEIKYYLPENLKKVTITNSSIIPNNAFVKNDIIEEVIIEKNLDSINYRAFYNCSSLKTIVIKEGVSKIGNYAFGSCSSLSNVTALTTSTSIGKYSFSYCNSLIDLTDLSINSMDEYALKDCTLLKYIKLDDEVSSINKTAFYRCNNLEYNIYEDGCYLGNDNNQYLALIKPTSSTINSFIINDKCKFILDSSFVNCNKIVEIYNLSNINIEIGSNENGGISYSAFVVHDSLNVPSIIKKDQEYLLAYNNEKLYLINYLGNDEDIILPNSFKYGDDIYNSYEINQYAFCNIDTIKSIIIPDNVTDIGKCAFMNMNVLTMVTLPNGITTIKDHMFSGCSSLSKVILPKTITSVEEYAFYNRYTGTTITIYYYGDSPYGDTIVEVGENADLNHCYWRYYTNNGENETKTGYWWYYDNDGKTIIEKIVRR